MITTNLPRNAAIIRPMAELIGNGGPGVRFAFISHEPGVGVRGTANAIVSAMGLPIIEMAMPMLTGDEMAYGKSARVSYEKRLGQLGDAFVILYDCNATPHETLRDTIEMLRLQDTDRDDEPRALLVLLATTGPVFTLREMVQQATGERHVTFAVVE